MTEKEMLEVLLRKIESLEEGQKETNNRLDRIELNVSEVRRDIKKIAWQVDTLYQWVDDIDIRSKSNRDIIDKLQA